MLGNRGIDEDYVTHVINYEEFYPEQKNRYIFITLWPLQEETGRKGIAVTFIQRRSAALPGIYNLYTWYPFGFLFIYRQQRIGREPIYVLHLKKH